MLRLDLLLTAKEYLSHAYEIPDAVTPVPLPDEAFTAGWQEAEGRGTLTFLADVLGLPAFDFRWEQEAGLSIYFASTLAGNLPVIATASHRDFRQMEALLSGREEVRDLPMTVNAFTLQARAPQIYRHRVLLLNYAPYSNIPAEAAGCPEEEWLERSHRLRLAHECAHYETLRLLGGMKNHALDEILADALGQLAAFGDFSADRQRLFFGLIKGEESCTGRLSFYMGKVLPEERGQVCRAVDRVLDIIEAELKEMLSRKAGEWEILTRIAGTSIAARLAGEQA